MVKSVKSNDKIASTLSAPSSSSDSSSSSSTSEEPPSKQSTTLQSSLPSSVLSDCELLSTTGSQVKSSIAGNNTALASSILSVASSSVDGGSDVSGVRHRHHHAKKLRPNSALIRTTKKMAKSAAVPVAARRLVVSTSAPVASSTSSLSLVEVKQEFNIAANDSQESFIKAAVVAKSAQSSQEQVNKLLLQRGPSGRSVQTAKSNSSLMKKVILEPQLMSPSGISAPSGNLIEDFFHLFHLEEDEERAPNILDTQEDGHEKGGEEEGNNADHCQAVQVEQAIASGLLWSVLYLFDLWTLALWLTVFCGNGPSASKF